MSPLAVRRITSPGLHFVGGVSGLALQVLPSGGRSWILRVMIGGRRRDMGLGGFPDVELGEARQAAREARALIRQGVDPIERAREAKIALRSRAQAVVTFKQAAEAYITAHSPGWRNPKHRQQWSNTLNSYAYPEIGHLSVADIDLPHVLAVLEPIWTAKNETASRLRGRIETVLDWATARGHRTGLNPARWRGHLDKLMAKRSTVAPVTHRPAIAIDHMPGAWTKLVAAKGVAATALRFAILTAARSGEVRGATWAEIQGDLWIIPASRMKANREHRVPLSPIARAILDALPAGGPNDHVFTAPAGGALSDAAMGAVLKRLDVQAVPHGFRSTFRDWAAERTAYPGEMAELALAHTISNKVEAAYRRGDMIEKRRRLMTDWAAFCAGGDSSGDVVPIRGAA